MTRQNAETEAAPIPKIPACDIVQPGAVVSYENEQELADLSLGRANARSLGALGVCEGCAVASGEQPVEMWLVQGDTFTPPPGCRKLREALGDTAVQQIPPQSGPID